MILTALLGALGSVSMQAQTNVYSLNVVGYINVTCYPGANIIACPLICSPTNTIGVLLTNNANQLKQCTVFKFDPSAPGGYDSDTAGTKNNPNPNGWQGGGTMSLNPGQAIWFINALGSNVTFTFVGTVPSGSLTNTIGNGANLISSILPFTGDMVTNSLTMFTNPTAQDVVFVYDTNAPGGYDSYTYSKKNSDWGPSDPVLSNVAEGFWYITTASSIKWVENYSVTNQ